MLFTKLTPIIPDYLLAVQQATVKHGQEPVLFMIQQMLLVMIFIQLDMLEIFPEQQLSLRVLKHTQTNMELVLQWFCNHSIKTNTNLLRKYVNLGQAAKRFPQNNRCKNNLPSLSKICILVLFSGIATSIL